MKGGRQGVPTESAAEAVKQVSGLNCATYEDRLQGLELLTLEEQRHQADMCMVHKNLQEKGDLQPDTWFEMAENNVRATHAERIQ